MNTTRRAFLASLLTAAAPSRVGGRRRSPAADRDELGLPSPAHEFRGDSSVGAALRTGQRLDLGEPRHRAGRRPFDLRRAGATLRNRFQDLPRHFVFEYYPWYAANPFRHWDEADRVPPDDLASNYMPLLGAYDSRARTALERHAAWIAGSGVGAVNISWWGQGSFDDRAVPLIMDVMRDHDIHVAFHLEPYADDRAAHYAEDILYLLREYGEKRRWDCLLLLENADGSSGPIFKSFRTIVPSEGTDCHGVTHRIPDYTTDSFWRRQTDLVREILRPQFDHVTLLADSLDFTRTRAGGFDGIAIYDNYVRPESWPRHAASCRPGDLVFSFNINPGFDGIVRRHVPTGSCYHPPRYEPGGEEWDWSAEPAREEAQRLSEARIDDALGTTVQLQIDGNLTNHRKGFFLTYVNSFNEWHEGHQFEPMRDRAQLTASESRYGYHNPAAGDYRLRYLGERLSQLLTPAADREDASVSARL